jgi:uncharacterized membrane-anchored protein YitT (DUF2179 family)
MNTSVIALLDALLLATLVGTCAGGVAIVVAVAAKRWPASVRHHVLLVAGAVSVVSLVSAAATND